MSASTIKSVAVIGAGASGAAAAAALVSEQAFDVVRVFERREVPGGTWIYDPKPPDFQLYPGKLPPETDPQLAIPNGLPKTTTPSPQERYDRTPIYAGLTTNVPAIAMSFSDRPFPYGPFVPHWVPKQYIENYFAWQRTDSCLVMNTAVEDVSRLNERWKLTLRRVDQTRHVDIWWEEEFDALIIANGHYSVPFVPAVKGLSEYMDRYPGRILHSKSYRTADLYSDKKVLVIGNSASGHDITTLLVRSGKPKLPVYQSRRSRSRWDGLVPPGVEWKPVIKEYTDEIVFEDGTRLDDIDVVIYCTGYRPSYPFWNAQNGPIYDYEENRLLNNWQHTFSRTFRNLGFIGLPRTLTFRSFEYQAVALARLFAGRNAPLPSSSEQERWEHQRADIVKREQRKFHDILWDDGETMGWLRVLYEIAGLPVLEGLGRCPPVLGEDTRWALKHVRKYPEPPEDNGGEVEGDWVVIEQRKKDSLHFI